MNRIGSGVGSGEQRVGQGPTIRSAVFVGQIITFALAKGTLIVAAVAAYLVFFGDFGGGRLGTGGGGDGAAGGALADGPTEAGLAIGQVLPLLGISLFAGGVVAAVWIPGLIRNQAVLRFRQSGETFAHPLTEQTPVPPGTPIGDLVAGLMTATLASQGILEGVAFINSIFLILTGQWLLMIPVIVALFGIVTQVPTVGQVMDRLESISRS